jgi:hypothetical protein
MLVIGSARRVKTAQTVRQRVAVHVLIMVALAVGNTVMERVPSHEEAELETRNRGLGFGRRIQAGDNAVEGAYKILSNQKIYLSEFNECVRVFRGRIPALRGVRGRGKYPSLPVSFSQSSDCSCFASTMSWITSL